MIQQRALFEIFGHKRERQTWKSFQICLSRGAGENRTPVHTRNQYAFYMFIPDFIFVCRQDPDHQPAP